MVNEGEFKFNKLEGIGRIIFPGGAFMDAQFMAGEFIKKVSGSGDDEIKEIFKSDGKGDQLSFRELTEYVSNATDKCRRAAKISAEELDKMRTGILKACGTTSNTPNSDEKDEEGVLSEDVENIESPNSDTSKKDI